MLVYKICDDVKKIDSDSLDFKKMLSLIMADYRNYYNAAYILQSRRDFSMQAIYSCLSKVNNDDNRVAAYKELSQFLKYVNEKANLCMYAVNDKNNLSVRERPKIKSLIKRVI